MRGIVCGVGHGRPLVRGDARPRQHRNCGLVGDFNERQSRLSLGTPSALLALGDYLFGRLTAMPVWNQVIPATTGDVFPVRMTQTTFDRRRRTAGVPAALGRINARGARSAVLPPGGARHAQLTAHVEGTDALDARLRTLVQSSTVKALMLP